MILETTQILTTSLVNNEIEVDTVKPTHYNHPCVKWCGDSRGNYEWLCRYLNYLHVEFFKRTNKTHAWLPHYLVLWELRSKLARFKKEFTEPPQVTGDSEKDDDVCVAYKLYLISKWEEQNNRSDMTKKWSVKWYKEKYKHMPDFYKEYLEEVK
jgi:hypothetical protein